MHIMDIHGFMRHDRCDDLSAKISIMDFSLYTHLNECRLKQKSIDAQANQFNLFQKQLFKEDIICKGESALLLENFIKVNRAIILFKHMVFLFSKEGGQHSGDNLSSIMSTLGKNWKTVGKEDVQQSTFKEIV